MKCGFCGELIEKDDWSDLHKQYGVIHISCNNDADYSSILRWENDE